MNPHLKPAPEYASHGKGLTSGKPESSKLGKNARKKMIHRSRVETFLDARLADLNRDGGEQHVKDCMVDSIDYIDEIHPVDGQPIRFNYHGAISYRLRCIEEKRRVNGFALLDLSEQVVRGLRPRL